MKITLVGEEAVRLEPIPGPMTIEAVAPDQLYSPFHMLAGGLAFCTYSVLASWASQAKLDSADIVIDVTWTFAEDPHRVGSIEMRIAWPSLPEPRRAAANRVADLCALHATLAHPPALTTIVSTGAGDTAREGSLEAAGATGSSA